MVKSCWRASIAGSSDSLSQSVLLQDNISFQAFGFFQTIMKFKENWYFRGNIKNNSVGWSNIVTLTKRGKSKNLQMLGDTCLIWKKQIFLAKLSPMIPKWSPSELFMLISFCLYLFCTIFQNASKLPYVIERLLNGNHSDLSSFVVVAEETSWRLLTKMAFPFCSRIFNGPRRTSFIPSVFDPVSAEGLFVPRRAPKHIRCMSSSLIKENTSHKRKAHILTIVTLWHVA